MSNRKISHPQRWMLSCCIALAFGGSAAAAQYTVPAAIAGRQVEFEVYLPLRNGAELDRLLLDQQDTTSANYHRWLTPAQFKDRYGADPDSMARVKQHLQANGLTVVGEHSHSVRVRGLAGAAANALGLSLDVKQAGGRQRIVAGAAQRIRAELSNEGAVVAAFSALPERRVHSLKVGAVPGNRYSVNGPYWFTDIKQAYDFPAYPTGTTRGLTGRGATVAILMSSDFLDSDLKIYLQHEKFPGPLPTTVHVSVDGATLDVNADAFLEAELDTQQVGGMAPGAVIREYNIPDLSDQSILDGYQAIVDDNLADVVSSSFGGPEDAYLPAYNFGVDYTYILTVTYESLFKQGNAQGMTFVASSGDSGGLSIPPPSYFYGGPGGSFQPGVEHPASSPHVTGVGGTNLQTVTGQGLNSAYVSENAYGDPEVPYDPYGYGWAVSGGYWGSGGGVSKVFVQPSYQQLVPTGSSQMRTVPDISLMEGGCPYQLAAVSIACPDSGAAVGRSAAVVADIGQFYSVIGTSVSAPEFAGVMALAIEQSGGRFGNVNNLLYTKAALQAHHVGPQVYRNASIAGFNGYEYTAPVYNQVIGLGTPYVRALIGALALPPAGVPQTPTNP